MHLLAPKPCSSTHDGESGWDSLRMASSFSLHKTIALTYSCFLQLYAICRRPTFNQRKSAKTGEVANQGKKH